MNHSQSENMDDLDAIARTVGFVVLQWGQAEESLDLLVATLWHDFDGKRYANAKKIPLMLEPKIEFVRKGFSSHISLSQFQNASEKLLVQFETLGNMRHDLIHGALASVSANNNGIVFNKLDIRDGYHHHRTVRIEATEFAQIMDKLIELGRMTHKLAAAVFDVVDDNTRQTR